MEKNRICYVSPVSIHSYRWIEAFHKKGYDVSLITDSSTLIAPTINFVPVYKLKTINITNFPCRFIPNTFEMARILKKLKPNLVHLHVQDFYSPAVFLSGLDYIFHSWGTEEELRLPHADFFRKSLARIAAVKARKVIVDAKCLKDIWVKIGIQSNKIVIIPFGVDTSIFNPKVNGQSIREKLEIESEETVIISTRLFYDKYDLELLIKAVPLIVKNYENVKFIIKGAGPPHIENYLKNLANKLRLHRHVRFVGLTPYDEIPQFLCAADIYVSTRAMDTTSVSLLEAMACGLPPVVTDVPGNREWIEDEVNGFLFPPRDIASLSEKIMRLIENPKLRKQFGKKCSKIVKQKATWEKCVSRMDIIYKSLLKYTTAT